MDECVPVASIFFISPATRMLILGERLAAAAMMERFARRQNECAAEASF
jgi:hypothetical protein